MGKKSKASPSQLAMSEVLEKEFKDEVMTSNSTESSKKEHEVGTEAPKAIKKKRRGAKYVKAATTAHDRSEGNPLSAHDAVQVIKDVVFSNIKETLELHINTLEEGIKGEVLLPFATGKKVRVAIATDAIVEQLEKGIVDFDLLVSTPAFMPKLTKFAKLLGPKGLMPNPKAGTLGSNAEELVQKFSGNVIRFKTEPKAPIIHVIIGKTSDEITNLVANIEAYLDAVGRKKIKSVFLSSTMSPSVRIQS